MKKVFGFLLHFIFWIGITYPFFQFLEPRPDTSNWCFGWLFVSGLIAGMIVYAAIKDWVKKVLDIN